MTIYISNKRKNTFAKIRHQQGSTNSQFGTCWIRHDLHGNKKIQKDLLSQYVEQGWIKGRISNNPARVGENYKPKYTKISQCTNCNKFFPKKRQNKTCSPECTKIRRSIAGSTKKNVNRRTQEMIMTGAIHPTYLYIKQHSITGIKYFGKTCQDPLKYKGSGQHWQDHYKMHGKKYIITTQLFGPFTDAAVISKFALAFSAEHDIVASKDWANMEPENGLNGAQFGRRNKRYTNVKQCINCNKYFPNRSRDHVCCSIECRKSIQRKPKTESQKVQISKTLTGHTHKEESKLKMTTSRTGKTHSDETKLNISEGMRKYHDNK
jgi:hypothetical protein